MTPRQREVLDLLARGRSNAEIAETLGVSLEGAKYHVREIMSKLDVESREEAADYWRQRNGLPARLRRSWQGTLWLVPAKWLAAGGMAAFGLTAGSVIIALLVALTSGANTDQTVNGDSVSAEEPSDNNRPHRAIETIASFEGEGHAIALHWRNEDELWYVKSTGSSVLVLVRHVVSTGKFAEWTVPEHASHTVHTYLVEDAKGVLWLGANYTVAAFDPQTEEFLYSAILDHRPEELAGDARSRYASDGSWITGMVVESNGSVILARHNVPALYRLGRGGPTLARLLQRPPTELRLISGEAHAIIRENDEAVFIADGSRRDYIDLTEAGCSLEWGVEGEGAKLQAGDTSFFDDFFISPHDPVLVEATAGAVVIGTGESGAVVYADCSQRTAAVYPLGELLVFVDGLAPADGQEFPWADPIRMPRVAESLALSPSGIIAAGLSTNELVLIR